MDEIAAWLRKQAEADLARARDLIESEAAAAEWSEPSSGVLVTGPPEHDDTWAGTFAIGDSRIVRHVVAHDPRTEIARAESVLAVLDLCEKTQRLARAPKDRAGAPGAGSAGVTADLVLALLAWGYRHREGFRPEWAPV